MTGEGTRARGKGSILAFSLRASEHALDAMKSGKI